MALSFSLRDLGTLILQQLIDLASQNKRQQGASRGIKRHQDTRGSTDAAGPKELFRELRGGNEKVTTRLKLMVSRRHD